MNNSLLDKNALRCRFNGINRKQLALSLGTTINVINQIAAGHQVVSAKRAVEIEQNTNGKVRASDLRPDIFSQGQHMEA